MRTEANVPAEIAGSSTQTREPAHVDVYLRHERPVALVLWQGAEPQPVAAFRASDDGRLVRYAVTANDDVPTHDRRETHLNAQVDVYRDQSTQAVTAVSLAKAGQDAPILTIVGSAQPMRSYPFNDRSNGIFTYDYRDRDGLPVGDTTGGSLRAMLHGRAARDWAVGQTAQLVAQYQSHQIAKLLEVVNTKSLDDGWREKFQDNGLVNTPELRFILDGKLDFADSKAEELPEVRVVVEPNTFSFFVKDNGDEKLVQVKQFTDFRGSLLEEDFPFGSANEWGASVPRSMSNRAAVDTIGQSLLRDWDVLDKTYPKATQKAAELYGMQVMTDDDFDAYVANEGYQQVQSVATMEVFLLRAANRFHTLDQDRSKLLDDDEAFDAWPKDKHKAWANLTDQFCDSTSDLRMFFSETPDYYEHSAAERKRLTAFAEALVNSGKDADRIKQAQAKYGSTKAPAPYDANNMDAAVAYTKATKALFARGEYDAAYERYIADPNGGAAPGMPFSSKKDFIATIYSERSVHGDPTYPQPTGYEYGGFTVGHKAHLKGSDLWGSISHVYRFDAKTYVQLNFEHPVAVDHEGKKHAVVGIQSKAELDAQHSRKLLVSAEEIDSTRRVADRLVPVGDIRPAVENARDFLDDRLSDQHTPQEQKALLLSHRAMASLSHSDEADVSEVMPVVRYAHDLIEDRWATPNTPIGRQGVGIVNDLRTVMIYVEHGLEAAGGTLPARASETYELRNLADDSLDSAYGTRRHAKAELDLRDHKQPLTAYVQNTVTGERHLGFAAQAALIQKGMSSADFFAQRDAAEDDLTADQRVAVAAFKDANGEEWKDRLASLWMSGNYSRKGISTDQAALLQQVRNQHGPQWLESVSDHDLRRGAEHDDVGMSI
jgi:hypothetical protein